MQLIRYSYPTATRFANAAYSRSPWTGLEQEIDRLFSAALSDFGGAAAGDRIPVDLYEDENNAYVRAELPGVKRDQIHVEVVDGYLNISAERENKAGDASTTTQFSRSVRLSEDVQTDKVSAAYDLGVLTVTLPKPEQTKPRKVTVQVN